MDASIFTVTTTGETVFDALKLRFDSTGTQFVIRNNGFAAVQKEKEISVNTAGC